MHEFCFYLSWAGWKPEVWAAWVQAIGSVVAIAVAVSIPWWQHRRERREKSHDAALMARSMATAYLRYVKEFHQNLSEGLIELGQCNPATRQRWTLSWIVIPQQLWDDVKSMHHLGDPGGYVLRSIYNLLESRAILADGSVLVADQYSNYEQKLRDAKVQAEKALQAIHRQLK